MIQIYYRPWVMFLIKVGSVMMSKVVFVLLTWMAICFIHAKPAPFVVNDDAFSDKITGECVKLMRKGKLQSIEKLRAQVRTKGIPIKLAALSREKFSPPELCERLRESTLAVGNFYKCPDCGEWHFNSSAGFVVTEDGVICTCCHVVVAEDKEVKKSFLVAADAAGHVYPVVSVLAADMEADTCFLKIDAHGMQPLALRSDIRTGENVYCLSHPGGYYFMFTSGMVARLNQRRDEAMDAQGHTNGLLTRPLLYLNITAEFAPGSSGAPIVDEAGNVVAQVSSIAEAGDPQAGDENTAPAPSVPLRFCISAREILGLADPDLEKKNLAQQTEAIPQRSMHMITTNRGPRTPMIERKFQNSTNNTPDGTLKNQQPAPRAVSMVNHQS
jgi:serine protease Do